MNTLRRIAVLLCLGMLAPSALAATEWSTRDYDLYPGDFNGDGRTDVLYVAKAADKASGIALTPSTGTQPTAGFQSWASNYLGIPWYGNYYRPIVADFNGDGRADVFMQRQTSGDHFLILATTAGNLVGISQTIPNTYQGQVWSGDQHRIVGGDMSGDGKADLLLQAASKTLQTAVFLASSTGQLTSAAQQVWSDGYLGFQWSVKQALVHLGDFNNDGKKDLFIQARPDTFIVAYESGVPIPKYRPNSFGIVLGRTVNGSGQIYYSPAQQVFSRNHLGIDWSATTFDPVIGDFNGDGYADVFLQSRGEGRNNVLVSSNSQGQLLSLIGITNSTLLTTATPGARFMAGNFDGTGGTGMYLQSADPAGNDYTAADVTLSAVNLIQQDPNLQSSVTPGTAVGSIPGQFEVDPSGAATYTMPLAVAPGVAGMAPELSLNYSSRSGNGLVGVGWSIGGLTSISRCGTIYDIDSKTDGVDFDADDKYCLDGQRLIHVTSTYGAVGTEYRTEMESFQRVIAVGGVANDPGSFTVETKSGQKLWYGDSTDSRIEAQGKTKAISWAVRRIEDKFHNYIAYQYGEDTARSGAWPTSITYGNGAGIEVGKVVLSYTNTRTDKQSGFLSGSVIGNEQRLAKVAIYARPNQSATQATARVREYYLNFEMSPTTGLSHLKSVYQCDGGTGGGQRCLGATAFDWQHGYRGFGSDYNTGVSTSALPYMKPLDINGDGRMDYTYTTSSKWYYRLGSIAATAVTGNQAARDAATALVMDVDSDGYADLVQKSSTNYLEWLRGSVSGFAAGVQSTTIPAASIVTAGSQATVGDFNGDGRQDIVYNTANAFDLGVRLAGSNGLSNSTLVSYPLENWQGRYGEAVTSVATPQVIDYNGDGRDDLLLQTSYCWYDGQDQSHCSPWLQAVTFSTSLNNFQLEWEGAADPQSLKTLDINGDGLTDILYFQSGVWKLRIGSGTGTGGLATVAWSASTATYTQRVDLSWSAFDSGWSGILPSDPAEYTVSATLTQTMLADAEVIDYNRDGRSDLLVAVNGKWRVMLSNGVGYDSLMLDTGRAATNASQAAIVDNNSDALPDILFPSSDQYHLYAGRGPAVTGVIEAVTDGFGAKTQIQYGQTNDPAIYAGHTVVTETGAAPAFPYANLGAPLPVVYRFSSDNGRVDGIYTVYQYFGLKVHRQGRGLVGFAKIRAWNDNAQIETINEYAQLFPYSGMLLIAQQKQPDYYTYANQLQVDNAIDLYLNYGESCEPTPSGCVLITPQPVVTQVTGKLVSKTTNTLTYTTLTYAGAGTTTKFPYVRKSIELGYPLTLSAGDPQPAVWKRTTTDYLDVGGGTSGTAYDNFGNPYRIKVTVDNGQASPGDVHVVDTQNYYNNDSTNWCLGRLRSTRVDHTRPTYAGSSNQAPTSRPRVSGFDYDASTCVLTAETSEPAQYFAPSGTSTNNPNGTSLWLRKAYAYDSFGNRTSETTTGADITARTTSVSYSADAANQFPTSATNALMQSELRTWDPQFGVQLSVTGPNGLTSGWQYDSFGRKLRETAPQTTIFTDWSYQWCPGGSGCTDSRAVYTVMARASDNSYVITEFDRLGRAVRERKPGADFGETWTSKYFDPLGREYLTTAPHFAGQAACFVMRKFDALGRIVDAWAPASDTECTTTVPDFKASLPAGGRVTHSQYDEVDATTGFLITTTVANIGDATGRTSLKYVNRMGRVRFVKDVISPTTKYTTEYDYEPAGNTSWVKDNAGNQTHLVYNARGFKTSMQDPDMGTWSYTYNVLGELLTQTDAKSQVTSLTYDALGRLKTRAEGAEGTTTWTYDSGVGAVGKLSSVVAPDGFEEQYVYSALGYLTDARRKVDGNWYWTSQTYDLVGRVQTVKYPNYLGNSTSSSAGADSERFRIQNVYSTYGALAQVQEVMAGGGAGTTYWQAGPRNAAGAVLQEALGNGLTTTSVIDAATGTLRKLTTGIGAGGSGVQNLEFVWDKADNLTSRKDRNKGWREDFGYDAIWRLTSSSRFTTLSGGSAVATESYTYDTIGNLLTKGTSYTGYDYAVATGCTHAHAQPHAVRRLAAGGTNRTYCYDPNGNVTTVTGGGPGYTGVTWNVANLAKVISKGSATAQFFYDPNRARYKQVAMKPAGTETTVYVGGLYEKISQGTKVEHVNYIRVGDETIAVKKWTQIGGGSLTPSVRYLHKDHLGSVAVITTETGAVETTLSYDPWGKRRDPSTWVAPAPGTFTAEPSFTDRGYTGHEHLDDWGLVNMNGRIYDPEIGRFLSADPTVQFPYSTQGYNRYAYAGNNPLSYVDPSGFGFLKSLMQIVGIVLNFIPGFQVWANWVIRAFIVGFLSSGGSLKAGLLGIVGGGLFGAIGLINNNVMRLLAHGVASGGLSVAGGGTFKAGFFGGGFGALGGLGSRRWFGDPGSGGVAGLIKRTVAAAVAGGFGSAAGGGKFGNGARTAAFAHLYNDEAHYIVEEGVVLTSEVEAQVGTIADDYFAATNQTMTVTSGTRTPESQAMAMYDKLAGGDDLSDYQNQEAAGEIKGEYDRGVAAGLDRSAVVTNMTAVIQRQVDRNVFVSKHLMAGAVDVRSRDMTAVQRQAFQTAAGRTASSVLLETVPPHWHLQF